MIMTRAKLGDRVRVQYLTLKQDGNDIEFSRDRRLMEFTVGSDEVISGISFGVVGMAKGEKKRLKLQPKEAYGAVRNKLIKEVSRQRFPSAMNLHIGQRVIATGRTTGRRRSVEIVGLKPDTVVVDGNHPLAGKILDVEVQLISLSATAAGPGESWREQ